MEDLLYQKAVFAVGHRNIKHFKPKPAHAPPSLPVATSNSIHTGTVDSSKCISPGTRRHDAFDRLGQPTNGSSLSTPAPARLGTRVLIRKGQVMEKEQPNPLIELSNDQRLQLLLAVKNGVISMDKVLVLGAELVTATQAGDVEKEKILLASLYNVQKDKEEERAATSDTATACVGKPSRDFEQGLLGSLDNVQRMAVMKSVKNKSLSIDEAMDLVQEYVNVNKTTLEQKDASSDGLPNTAAQNVVQSTNAMQSTNEASTDTKVPLWANRSSKKDGKVKLDSSVDEVVHPTSWGLNDRTLSTAFRTRDASIGLPPPRYHQQNDKGVSSLNPFFEWMSTPSPKDGSEA